MSDPHDHDAEGRRRAPPRLLEFEKNFEQEADCCDPEGPMQFICVKQNDGGGGPFWVIQTERWAIDSIDELVALLKEAGMPQSAELEEPRAP